MRKIIFFAIGLLLIMPAQLMAAPTAPERTVWTQPENVDAGDTIELDAFVYNSAAKTATVTVLFASGETEIATTTITIAPQTGKVALAAWQQPKKPTTLTASVITAVDATKKNIPELLGVIGTTTVGEDTRSLLPAGLEGDVKDWFQKITARFEPWRKKQADYFTALRNKKKDELGINTVKDLTDRFESKDDVPGVPSQEPTVGDLAPQSSNLPIGDYAILLVSTALAAVFSSATLFYVAAVLLAVMILRFFFSLFR